MRYKYFYTLYSACLHRLRQNYSLLFLTFISSISLALLVIRTPQGLYSDPAWQIKALQQYLAGESPSFNHCVMPQAEDLFQGKAGWIGYWPPGTQLLAYPLMANRIVAGDAIRIIAIVCLVLGSLGWVRWFSLFNFPPWVKISLAILLPWMHYPSNALFMYSAEILVYASAPWILLLTYRLSNIWKQRKFGLGIILMSAPLGFALGFVYILKYSAVFVSLGALVYLGLFVYNLHKNTNRHLCVRVLISFLLVIVFFIIPIATYNLINYKFGGYLNQITLRAEFNLRWENSVFILANPALIAADADSLWNYVLLHPTHGLLKDFSWPDPGSQESSMWLALVGLPGGLLLLWLSLYSDVPGGKRSLALSVFFTSLVVMLGIWTVSRIAISYQARYLAGASIAILPLAIQAGFSLWSHNRSRIIRLVLICGAISYIVIPLLYGGVSVIAKVMRTPRDYKVGPSRIYNHLLAQHDLAGVRDRLLRYFSADTDIWYIPEPMSALDLPGRAIITHADFEDKNELERRRYISRMPLRIHALLPPIFEANGKGQIIRKSFVQAKNWVMTKIDGCNYFVWTATINVDSDKVK